MTHAKSNALTMPRPGPILILILLLFGTALAQPRHLYLTWEIDDTAHSQTIAFQTLGKAKNPRVKIQFADGPKVYKAKTVTVVNRRTHYVTVTGLEAAKTYRFLAGDDLNGFSPWRSFRTLPEDGRAITIVTGGDMYRHPETIQLLRAASQFRPDVALVGGDIAYTNGELRNMSFWDSWFDNWEANINPKDGPMVPMICAIGNHEVQGHFGKSKAQAPMYFGFLPQGGVPYFTRRLGQDISVVVLDSGHVTAHQAQVAFLDSALKAAKTAQARHTVALYHVPLYPTHRDPRGYYHAIGRAVWAPVFDKYKLTVALENHEHVFKRTHPIKGNKIDPSGTVYLGDGCWGRNPRVIPRKHWYHFKALRKEHIWLLSNIKTGLDCRAVDLAGKVFDRTTLGGQ